MKNKLLAFLPLTFLCVFNFHTPTALAQGTAFTYQGRLDANGSPVSGSYDLQFGLWSAASGPAQLGSPLTNTANAVNNGRFTVMLDFGATFPGADRWLEIGVRTNGGGSFVTLSPRQKISPTPYAITAGTAGALVIPPGMALIPAGDFTMGNSIGDADITDATLTNVTVSAFYMDVNLVSLSQWQSVYFRATNSGYGFVYAGSGKAANHPVYTVDWFDAVKWCNARSQQTGLTPVYYTDAGLTQVYTNGEVAVYANWAAKGYRLPTEAEWERSARGGLSGQRFPWGNVISQNLANYRGFAGSFAYDVAPSGYNPTGSVGGTSPATSPVGSFAANGYGLYDMAGNVLEWCWDWYGTPYAGGMDPHGPVGPLSDRVSRGGFWDFSAKSGRCADRSFRFPPTNGGWEIGFRCVRGL